MSQKNAQQFLARINRNTKLYRSFFELDEHKQKELIQRLDLNFNWEEFQSILEKADSTEFKCDDINNEYYDQKIEDMSDLIANIHLTY